MNMSALVDLAGTGATWVLYALIALSGIQVALVIERGIVFYRTRAPSTLRPRVMQALATDNIKAVGLVVASGASLEAKVLARGVATADRGSAAASEVMHASLVEERIGLERGLGFLGTVGNNAPFLGLFGTVLGIIHAFADLSASASGQASRAVMSGISEALIATAVGLIVALPAVATFNFFQRAIKMRAATAESLGGELMAHLVSPVDSLKTTEPAGRPAVGKAA
jgi:biopolymer transport protein ExbB